MLVGVTMTEERAAAVRRRAAARRRRQRRIDLAGRFAELVDRLRAIVDAFANRCRSTRGRRRSPTPPTPDRRHGPGRLAARPARPPARGRRRRGTTDGTVAPTPLALPEIRALLADRLRGPADARELPHRPPDDLHARADALGAAPRRLPARPRRRRLPAQDGRATATTCCSPTRTSATATRAPRTASCCSTRCWPRPTSWSITYTGNDERTNLRRPPAVPLGELLDVVDRTARFADGDGARAGRRRAPAAAVRPAQLRRRRAGARADVELRPGHARRARGRSRTASVGAPPFLAAPLAARAGVRWSSSTTSSASSSTRCGRSCASGSASSVGDATTRSRTRCRSSSTRSSSGASASGCSTARLAGADRDAAIAAEIARGELPPELLAEPVIARVCPIVEQLVAAAADHVPAAEASASVDVKVQLPDGRTAERDGARRPRRPARAPSPTRASRRGTG